jgi:hypothetical protein
MRLMFAKTVPAAIAVLMLSACTTYYHPKNFTGQGVEAAAVMNDVYRVSALGSGMTDASTIQDFVLLKSAETTLEHGKTHFVILSAEDATKSSTYRSSGTITSNVYGSAVFSTYQPGQTYDIIQPGKDLMIRIFTPAAGEALPPGAFPAQEVFDNINPRVKRLD